MTNIPTLNDMGHIAREAGKIAHEVYFSSSMGLEWKQDETPLTAADRGVRDFVASYMPKHFPAIPVIGEEGQLGKRTGMSDEYWMLVDEVDGTWAFMIGAPMFTCMFALMRGNEPVMSAIMDPVSKRLYIAERGKGAFLNGTRISVERELPKNSSVGFVSWPNRNLPGDMLVPGMIDGVVTGLHKMGCYPVNMITIGYLDAMVANGKLSATIFPAGTLHDTAAGHLLVEEAGGKATDLRGKPLSYDGTKVFGHIFSNGIGDFHEHLVKLVKDSL